MNVTYLKVSYIQKVSKYKKYTMIQENAKKLINSVNLLQGLMDKLKHEKM